MLIMERDFKDTHLWFQVTNIVWILILRPGITSCALHCNVTLQELEVSAAFHENANESRRKT
jgi:hypothetical protein